MKTLFFVTSSYPPHDYKFIKSLKERGLDISVFIIRPQIISEKQKVSQVKYYSKNRNNFLPYSLDYFFSFISLFFLLKYKCQKEKPDILHGGNIQTAGFLCALVGYKPFLLMPYGSDALIIPQKNKLFMNMSKFVIKKSSGITCDAETVRAAIFNLVNYKKKILVFPWGVDHTLFDYKLSSEKFKNKLNLSDQRVILCSRAHYKIYGIEYIISSMRYIIKKIPEAHLLLMGYTPLSGKSLTSKYKDIIKKWNLGSNITITDPVENDAMPHYISISEIYLSASFSDGTSVSLIEAMAMAKPVIVSDIPSNREWVTDNKNGFLCQPGNSLDISLNVIKLLNDNNLKSTFGEKNLVIAREKANWEKNINKLTNFYSEMVTI